MYDDTEVGAKGLIAETIVNGEQVLKAIAEGRASLVPDPQVTNVWGVRDADGKVRAVLYLAEGDFEADEEWLFSL